MSALPETGYSFASNGATDERAPGPIGGPGAWRGVDMAGRQDEWLHEFSAAELTELENALQGCRKTDIIDIRRGNFVLPALGQAFDTMRRELLEGRGFLVLRGLPTDKYSIEETARIYFGLGSYFGNPRSQNAKGHLLGHVCDLGARYDAFKRPGSTRVYQTHIRQPFHTDSVDVVSLLCLQKSKSGGESSICSSYTVHDQMWAQDRDLWAELYKPMWRDRRGEIPPGKIGYYPMAAFHYFDGRLSTNYGRDYVDSTTRFEELPPIPEKLNAAMDLFDRLANDRDNRLDMHFEPGDIQILHNHQILHARADFEDWPEVERKRHLLRLWLSPEDGRPLPPSFLERYLGTEIGNRGGIVEPGTRLCCPLEPE